MRLSGENEMQSGLLLAGMMASVRDPFVSRSNWFRWWLLWLAQAQTSRLDARRWSKTVEGRELRRQFLSEARGFLRSARDARERYYRATED